MPPSVSCWLSEGGLKNRFASPQKWSPACRNSISEFILQTSGTPCSFWLLKSKPRWSVITDPTCKIEQTATKSLSNLLCEGLGLQAGDEVLVWVKICSSVYKCFCVSPSWSGVQWRVVKLRVLLLLLRSIWKTCTEFVWGANCVFFRWGWRNCFVVFLCIFE